MAGRNPPYGKLRSKEPYYICYGKLAQQGAVLQFQFPCDAAKKVVIKSDKEAHTV